MDSLGASGTFRHFRYQQEPPEREREREARPRPAEDFPFVLFADRRGVYGNVRGRARARARGGARRKEGRSASFLIKHLRITRRARVRRVRHGVERRVVVRCRARA